RARRVGVSVSALRSPSLGDRRAAEHLGNARARRSSGTVGQRIEGEEAVPADLATRDGYRGLAECSHDEECDVITPGDAIVEEYSLRLRWRRHLDIALLLQFPRQRLTHRLADLDPAARQVPATHVAMIDQKDAPLLVDHEPAHPERHGVRKAPIGMQDAPQR